MFDEFRCIPSETAHTSRTGDLIVAKIFAWKSLPELSCRQARWMIGRLNVELMAGDVLKDSEGHILSLDVASISHHHP